VPHTFLLTLVLMANTEVDRLIKQLGSDSFAVREAAAKALERIGDPALPALREAAKSNPDVEIRRRSADLVHSILEWPKNVIRDLGGKLEICDGTSDEPWFAVDLCGASIRDEDLQIVRRLGRVAQLNLSDTAVTDAALTHVRRMVGLRHLLLNWTPVTDEGVSTIAEAADLETLDLSGSKVTDAGIACLRKLTRLKMLKVRHTQVSAAGASALKKHLPLVRIER
jgi:hypothetical protein